MKVIVVDNFDREGPGAVPQRVIAGPGLDLDEARQIASEKNEEGGPMSREYYRVVSDDYTLQPDWEP